MVKKEYVRLGSQLVIKIKSNKLTIYYDMDTEQEVVEQTIELFNKCENGFLANVIEKKRIIANENTVTFLKFINELDERQQKDFDFLLNFRFEFWSDGFEVMFPEDSFIHSLYFRYNLFEDDYKAYQTIKSYMMKDVFMDKL